MGVISIGALKSGFAQGSRAALAHPFEAAQKGFSAYLGGGWKSGLSIAGMGYGAYQSYKRGDDLGGYAMNMGTYGLGAWAAPRAFGYGKSKWFGGAAKAAGGVASAVSAEVGGAGTRLYTAAEASAAARTPAQNRGRVKQDISNYQRLMQRATRASSSASAATASANRAGVLSRFGSLSLNNPKGPVP